MWVFTVPAAARRFYGAGMSPSATVQGRTSSPARSSTAARVRIRPQGSGRWCVEGPGGRRAIHPTAHAAERDAITLLMDGGGGDLFVCDAYLRVQARRRIEG